MNNLPITIANKYVPITIPHAGVCNCMGTSILANNYRHIPSKLAHVVQVGTRDEACDRYNLDMHSKPLSLEVRTLLEKLATMVSQEQRLVLQCCCTPNRCHTHTVNNLLIHRAITGFNALPDMAKFPRKDVIKFYIASHILGIGSRPGSSSARYAKGDMYGLKYETSMQSLTRYSVVGISINGGKSSPELPPILETVVDANCLVVIDSEFHREREYNIGERNLFEYFTSRGYTPSAPELTNESSHAERIAVERLVLVPPNY